MLNVIHCVTLASMFLEDENVAIKHDHMQSLFSPHVFRVQNTSSKCQVSLELSFPESVEYYFKAFRQNSRLKSSNDACFLDVTLTAAGSQRRTIIIKTTLPFRSH